MLESSFPLETMDTSYTKVDDRKATAKWDSRFSCNICLEAVKEPVVTQCGHLYCWPCLYQWLEPGMHPNERRSLSIVYPRQLPVDESRRVCPVCKSSCSVPTLVPIYVRNDEPFSPSESHCEDNAHELETSTTSNLDTDSTTNNDDPSSSTGLRQRVSRHQSTQSITEENQVTSSVPARPAANNPSRTSTIDTTSSTTHGSDTPTRNSSVFVSSLSPTTHRASLSHGLALSFQQAMMSSISSSPDSIPSLHDNRRDGNFHQTTDLESDPDSTEFLSRLLLMLGSFVIFCLLLF